jgi:3-phenylpropionate/cinnamic acid dioxygenase small subunit
VNTESGVDEFAENGIRRALAEYCAFVDDGEFARWAELFTSDAILKGNGSIIASSREGIRQWVTDAVPPRSGGKHMTVNSIIRVAERTATVSSDFFWLSRSAEGPVVAAAGRYIDTLVSEEDRWRFAEREIVLPMEWIRMPPAR